MDLDRARAFIQANHRAVLLTRHADGRPQLSPVIVGLARDGRHAVISTRETAVKTRNVRRDPNVALCVFTDAFFGEWVQIDGTAEVLDAPDSVEPLVEYYRNIAGEHPDWDEYRAAMVKQGKSLIRITPERWGPVATGGFPARLAESD